MPSSVVTVAFRGRVVFGAAPAWNRVGFDATADGAREPFSTAPEAACASST